MNQPSHPARHNGDLIGAVLGALVGGGASSLIYVLVNPVLERSSGLLRETQGLLWSTVPVCTILGALMGRAIARRRHRGT
ncbi:MAG: hypothetical protein HIU84_06885 [Acidobacteria bacterium]|nr:hypothetical protein [Acidobacteriota bacterium]